MFDTIFKGFSWFPATDKYCHGALPSLLLIACLPHLVSFFTEESEI